MTILDVRLLNGDQLLGDGYIDEGGNLQLTKATLYEAESDNENGDEAGSFVVPLTSVRWILRS